MLHKMIVCLGLLGGLSLIGCAAPAATTPAPTSLPPTLAPTLMPTPTAIPLPTLGSTRIDAQGIEQVWVPAGVFRMGTEADAKVFPPSWAVHELASEQPAHEVEITAGFWIDKYEVTQAAFQAFIDAGGYTTLEYWSEAGQKWLSQKDISRLPVKCVQAVPEAPQVCITWYEAEAYAGWRGGQLPTEAQWEYAARGPESRIYPWGDEFDKTKANVGPTLMKVGSFPDGISWVGAHDLAGNAMEWVQDWLGITYYQQGIRTDPTGPETGSRKVEKGGWWGGPAYVTRSAYRHFEDPPGYQDHHIGFRIIKSEGTP